MLRRVSLSFLSMALLLATILAMAPKVYASASMIGDPRGDGVPGYQDIVRARVIEQADMGRLFLSMAVASPVPKHPDESALYWTWNLDTDPNSAPYGYPADYVVHVNWDGNSFTAFLFDRAAYTSSNVTFSIDGVTVKAFVDLSAINNPSCFAWSVSSKPLPGTPDFAPDTGWASWER